MTGALRPAGVVVGGGGGVLLFPDKHFLFGFLCSPNLFRPYRGGGRGPHFQEEVWKRLEEVVVSHARNVDEVYRDRRPGR